MSVSKACWRNFLFDLDGTLVDSSPLHERAYRAVLAQRRADLLPRFSYAAVKAQTTRDGFRSLGIADEAELDAMVTYKRRHFRDAVSRRELIPMTGARELLTDLKHAAKRLFVVSSGSVLSVAAALEGTGLACYFEHVITADDVRRGKPAPDAFLLCLSRFALDPAASVAIEDAQAGVAAACAAGLAVIALHDPAAAAQADGFFPDFAAFHRWLAWRPTEEVSVR